MTAPPALDATHDPALTSWVASANGHGDFPIQNLPFGVFRPAGGAPRGGVAIGAAVLDLGQALAAGAIGGPAAEAAAEPTLNGFLAMGAEARRDLRRQLARLLAAAAPPRPDLLWPAAACAPELPARIGDYSDFYAGIHHATNVGRLFRPDAPLLENYKHVPIGYHGRASSIMVSGQAVRRPTGQRKGPQDAAPRFEPSRRLDYELELALWVGGPGNRAGEAIPIARAADSIAGYSLFNDWSARDLQAWEYQPLGPFLAKSFASTLSPWIVTPEALAPFRIAQAPRPPGDPAPLDYLSDPVDQATGALDLELEVLLSTPAMRAQGLPARRLALSNARHLYWTPAQLIAHHASNGCPLRPGDLLATGTISGPDRDSLGSLLELSVGGREAVALGAGESRSFLEDGDEVVLHARARRPGFASIGFGACRGLVAPA